MSKEGDKRRSALFRMKLFTGLYFILGFVILLCAGLGTEYYDSRSIGVPYYIGGFIVGPTAILIALLLVNVLVAAIDKSVDNDEIKKIASKISCQYSMSTLLFPACFIGCIFTGIWGINYDEEDDKASTNRSLAAVILTGIILVFLVNLVGVCTVRSHGKYFGVVLSRKGRHTAFVSTTSNNGGVARSNESGLVIQNNVNVISNGNNQQHVNQLEQENILLQQQIALQQQMMSQQRQQQQQQQQFTGGMYPPPPPSYSDSDPAYPPMTSFPEASAPPPPPYSKA